MSLKEMVKTSCGDKPLYITNPYSLTVPRKCSPYSVTYRLLYLELVNLGTHNVGEGRSLMFTYVNGIFTNVRKGLM